VDWWSMSGGGLVELHSMPLGVTSPTLAGPFRCSLQGLTPLPKSWATAQRLAFSQGISSRTVHVPLLRTRSSHLEWLQETQSRRKVKAGTVPIA